MTVSKPTRSSTPYGVSDFVSVPVTKVLGPFTEKIGAFCVGVFGRVAVGNSSR